MAKEFTWHCGASSLVDENYIKFDIKANGIEEAWCKAMDHINKTNVLDEGTLEMEMDTRDLAIALGNLAADNDKDWEPVMLLQELEKVKDKKELMSTLEWIVSNANKEV